MIAERGRPQGSLVVEVVEVELGIAGVETAVVLVEGAGVEGILEVVVDRALDDLVDAAARLREPQPGRRGVAALVLLRVLRVDDLLRLLRLLVPCLRRPGVGIEVARVIRRPTVWFAGVSRVFFGRAAVRPGDLPAAMAPRAKRDARRM